MFAVPSLLLAAAWQPFRTAAPIALALRRAAARLHTRPSSDGRRIRFAPPTVPRIGVRRLLTISLTHRVAAMGVLVPFVLASCATPPGTTTTPTTDHVSTSAPTVVESSDDEISEDDAMAIALSELARHMRQELGPDWVSLTRRAMGGRLMAAGAPAESVEALHNLMRSVIATRPAANSLDESHVRSEFRRHMRRSLETRGDDTIALDPAMPSADGGEPSDPSVPPSDYTCDIYNICRGQNYQSCYAYADLEVRAHETMLWAGCAFVAAIGTVVTLSAGAVLAGICIAAPSYWSSLVHSDAMDTCFTARCGSYPSCI